MTMTPTPGAQRTGSPRIPKAEITGAYGFLLTRITRRLLGDVPEPAEVMWHNRAVLTSTTGLGRKAQKWDRLDPAVGVSVDGGRLTRISAIRNPHELARLDGSLRSRSERRRHPRPVVRGRLRPRSRQART